jgi:hypothetical protein
MVFIYLIIIILVPLFLDYLFRLTVRRKRKINMLYLAEKKSASTKKPLLIFNNRSSGLVSHSGNLSKDKEEIHGEITEIIGGLKENSFVIVISETLEYVDDIEKLIKELIAVSGSDLYIINLEKNSPRIFWDYKIKNVMDQPFYVVSNTPVTNNKLKWTKSTALQKSTQKFYSNLFKILPYDFFVNDPVEKA